MSDFAQYPYEVLEAVGSQLTGISDQVSATSKNAFEIGGLTSDQARISEALDDFRHEWEASLTKLGENIGGFGDTSTQIGTLSGQFDNELGRSMRVGGAGGTGGSGGSGGSGRGPR